MLNALKYYQTEDRLSRIQNAIPVIFFERCTHDGRASGNVTFQGFGVLESAELVTQYNSNHQYFANYLFNFCVFSLAENNEQFDWDWIRDRCDESLEAEETLRHAPESWKRWINEGSESLHLVRRSISGQGLIKEREQLPTNGTLLQKIYDYYGGVASNTDKHDFEYLAMEVTARVIEESGATCVPGWITKTSGDGGVDFILRIDVGRGDLASVKIIVLGQAKCTKPSTSANGRDIARTVARLKRGWIGAFVTTSYFSEPVQREVKEDSYPLMMINGAKIVEVVEHELFQNKMTLEDYLESLKNKYRQMIRIPEDVLDL